MKILVLNSGSSSLKFKVMDMKSFKPIISGHVDGIGLERCLVKYSGNASIQSDNVQNIKVKDHSVAIKMGLEKIDEVLGLKNISAVGHRVVHGGEDLISATLIDSSVIRKIDKYSCLAPIHNPYNLKGIAICRKMLKVPQIAVFDTAFHHTIPKKAFLYAIPMEFYRKYKIRKYGFHGTSHKYVSLEAEKIIGKGKKIISCHLGNGSSLCAIKNGKSIDTTMGFTPLQGLIMGTRSGDIDPEIIPFLMEKEKLSVKDIIRMLNKQSGLLGLAGNPDVRELYKQERSGNKTAKLALDMSAYRVAGYIGSYNTILGGADAIVMTAGIGEGGYFFRKKVFGYLSSLDISIDYAKNRRNEILVSKKGSKVKLLVIPTNEELMIAKESKDLLKKSH
ncbi:acetate kinase [Candidatus Woesearchaeota archaeon]|nr:acetate kinase [Candidatus Woesearchaeota archaeon]